MWWADIQIQQNMFFHSHLCPNKKLEFEQFSQKKIPVAYYPTKSTKYLNELQAIDDDFACLAHLAMSTRDHPDRAATIRARVTPKA